MNFIFRNSCRFTENWKDNIKLLYTTHPVSLINILDQYDICHNELRFYYYLKSIYISNFLGLHLISFFCCRISSRILCSIYYHVSSLLWKFLRLPLFLMTLSVLSSTSQIFCRSLPMLEFDIFLIIRLELRIFRRKSAEMPFPSFSINGTYY